MNKLNNILAGIDFPDCSRSALAQAVRLAKWNNSRLHTLHALEYLTLSDTAWASHIPQEKLEQDAVAEAKQNPHQWLKQSKAASETEVLVDVGSPIDCILRRIRETRADLLVLGVSASSMIPMTVTKWRLTRHRACRRCMSPKVIGPRRTARHSKQPTDSDPYRAGHGRHEEAA